MLLTHVCMCTRSPNGDRWPKYEADEKYLAIGLKEHVTGQHLKEERFMFLTQTLLEKYQHVQQEKEHSEL